MARTLRKIAKKKYNLGLKLFDASIKGFSIENNLTKNC